MNFDPIILHQELSFRTSRSSGSGGQHVNKVETRVELLFDIGNSAALSDEQKAQLHERLSSRVNKEGVLIIASQASRSQQTNKELTIEKFDELVIRALQPRKKRRRTAVPRAAREKRLQQKQRVAEKKALRGRVRRD
jgi:ribosome-associated protein